MDGLNGEIVYQAKHVYAGTVPGAAYGYRRPLKVTVHVQVERLTRREEYETTDHRTVSRPLDFAISAAVWLPDGRDITASTAGAGTLGELTTYADGYSAGQAATLLELAGWHLNGMTAGCAHQTAVRDEHGQVDLDATPRCPVTGYKYGSAWLVRELPGGFLDQLRAAMPPADGVYTEPGISNAPPTLRQRMKADGMTGKVRHTRTRGDGTRLWRGRYTLAGRVLSVPYFTGAGVKDAPTADQILSTAIGEALDYENTSSMEEFASGFGYDIEDPATRRTYHTLEIHTHKLSNFLGDAYRAYLDETER